MLRKLHVPPSQLGPAISQSRRAAPMPLVVAGQLTDRSIPVPLWQCTSPRSCASQVGLFNYFAARIFDVACSTATSNAKKIGTKITDVRPHWSPGGPNPLFGLGISVRTTCPCAGRLGTNTFLRAYCFSPMSEIRAPRVPLLCFGRSRLGPETYGLRAARLAGPRCPISDRRGAGYGREDCYRPLSGSILL
jgi:hypothetical protein